MIVPGAWVDDTIRGAPTARGRSTARIARPATRRGLITATAGGSATRAFRFFHASGINGQNVFVHVPSQTVVAKLSTWPTALSPALDVTVQGVLAISGALQNGQLC